MLLFRGEEHIGRWCAQWNQPAGATLTIHQVWRLARAFYGTKMSPDWRRPTLEEIEGVLSRLGLTGAYWDLR